MVVPYGDGSPTEGRGDYGNAVHDRSQYTQGHSRSNSRTMDTMNAYNGPQVGEDTSYRSQTQQQTEHNSRQEIQHNGDRLGADHSPAPRDATRNPNPRRPSAQRYCGKCGESLSGQFVRALGDTFHLECFTCNVRSLCATSYFSVIS